jgi:hypothetical protein
MVIRIASPSKWAEASCPAVEKILEALPQYLSGYAYVQCSMVRGIAQEKNDRLSHLRVFSGN